MTGDAERVDELPPGMPSRGDTLRPVVIGALIAGVGAGLGQPGVIDGVDDAGITQLGVRITSTVFLLAALEWSRAGSTSRRAVTGAAPAALATLVAVVTGSSLVMFAVLALGVLAPAFAAAVEPERPLGRRLASLGAGTAIGSFCVFGGYSIVFILGVVLRLDELDGVAHGVVYGVSLAIGAMFVAGAVAIATHMARMSDAEGVPLLGDPASAA